MSKSILAAFITLAFAGVANAALVGNGPPDQSGGSDLNGYLLADRFTLATGSSISSITYWTLQNSGADYSGTTTVDIFADDGSGLQPGSLVAAAVTAFAGAATGVPNTLGYLEFAYTAAFSTSLLAAGDYWLALHNGPIGSMPGGEYYWEWQNGVAGRGVGQDLSIASPPWVAQSAAYAFQLTTNAGTTTVPEPTSIALAAIALWGASASRRRKGSTV